MPFSTLTQTIRRDWQEIREFYSDNGSMIAVVALCALSFDASQPRKEGVPVPVEP